MSDPTLSSFHITLADGSTKELRYSWPAFARGEEWLSAPWYRWDLFSHRELPAAIAAGLLHGDKSVTPDSVMAKLAPSRMREYREMVDDAISYTHSGKTRAERVAEKEAPQGEAEADQPSE